MPFQWLKYKQKHSKMNIVHYLISQGYKTYRWSKNGYIPCDNNFDFSSMREGGLDVRLVKDDSQFVYGLNEKNKPPTLIHPRPFNLQSDNEMNTYLRENTIENIYKELLSKSRIK